MAAFFEGRGKITPWIEPAVLDRLWEEHRCLRQRPPRWHRKRWQRRSRRQPPGPPEWRHPPPPRRGNRTKLAQVTHLDLPNGWMELSDGTGRIRCYMCDDNETNGNDDENHLPTSRAATGTGSTRGNHSRRETTLATTSPLRPLAVGGTVKVSSWRVSARCGRPCLLVVGTGGVEPCGGGGTGVAGNPRDVAASVAVQRFARTIGPAAYWYLLRSMEVRQGGERPPSPPGGPTNRWNVRGEAAEPLPPPLLVGNVRDLLRRPVAELEALLASPLQVLPAVSALPPEVDDQEEEDREESDDGVPRTELLVLRPRPDGARRFPPAVVGYSLQDGRPILTVDCVSEAHLWCGRVLRVAEAKAGETSFAGAGDQEGNCRGARGPQLAVHDNIPVLAPVASQRPFSSPPLSPRLAKTPLAAPRPPIPRDDVMSCSEGDSKSDEEEEYIYPETQRPCASMGIGALLVDDTQADPLDLDGGGRNSNSVAALRKSLQKQKEGKRPATATPPPSSRTMSARSSTRCSQNKILEVLHFEREAPEALANRRPVKSPFKVVRPPDPLGPSGADPNLQPLGEDWNNDEEKMEEMEEQLPLKPWWRPMGGAGRRLGGSGLLDFLREHGEKL